MAVLCDIGPTAFLSLSMIRSTTVALMLGHRLRFQHRFSMSCFSTKTRAPTYYQHWTKVSCFSGCYLSYYIHTKYHVLQSQKEVSDHLYNEKIMSFGFERDHFLIHVDDKRITYIIVLVILFTDIKKHCTI